MKTSKISKSEGETRKMGESLGKNLKGGDIVALYGNLGAGKTVFVKGIARGLGIKKRILSPTFVFMRSYPITAGKQFVHIDLYRGQDIKDFEALGLEELFTKENIVVLEWAERLKDYLPKKRIDVAIEKKDEKIRKIMISSIGNQPLTINNHPPVIARSTSASLSVNSATKQSLKGAASILKNGGVVIFPTDTVYGIGCRMGDKDAVARIYKIKKRSQGQPFPYLVSNIKQVEKLAIVTPLSRKLMAQYWPGGLTIILPARLAPQSKGRGTHGTVYPELVSGSQKIGFRMPDHQEILSMIDLVGVPIIGTSANFHGKPSPKSYQELDPEIIRKADYVLRGDCQKGVQSTVIDITTGKIRILRQGAITLR